MKEMETEMVKYPNKLTKPTKRWIRLRYYPPLLQWQSKKRDQNEILVSQIHEIRLGMNTLGFSLYEKSPALEERAFSVIYLQQGKFKFLNLLAQNQEETLKWVNTLHQLMSLDYQISDFDTWLTRIWDNEHKQFMNVDEITLVFKRLNLNLSKREVKSAFKFSNLGKQGQMCYSDFEKLYKSLRYRPEIAQLFSSLAQDSPLCISFDEFYRFLKRDQRVSWTLERSKEMFGKFSDQNRMSIDHFTAFLMSTRNSIFKKEHLHTHQDMTHPLAHYYINSSHNTYLLGDQVAGYSSVEGYIRALQRGCKCVEIDVWDGPNQMPLVYHGRTLTSKITFKEVMEAIAKYAFCVSQMPLILSIEVRCSAETQNHMAKLMRDILGDMLLAAPLDNVTDPSPWDLRGKILVKANTYRLGDDDEEEPKRRLSPPMMSRSRSRNGSSLTSLIIYLRGVSFKDNLEPGDMISVNDRKIQQLETKLFPELVQSNIVRVYPSLIHFTSSNFDPIHHWLRGTQMVALNFQTDDRAMDLNQALFRLNGNCGYVLKPSLLMPPIKLVVNIISGQQIIKPTDSFFNLAVDVESIGPETHKQRTKPMKSRGNNVNWKDSFVFHISCSLSFLRLAVIDVDSKTVYGTFTCLVSSLEQGYRHVPLFKNGHQIPFSTLFVYISITAHTVS